MPWIQTQLTLEKSQVAIMELLLEALGALSITLGDAANEPLLEPGPGETPLWSTIKITGLFSGDTDIDDLRSAFNQALTTDISKQLHIEILQDENWERSWLDRFAPMQFGQHLWICPTGHKVEQAEAVVIDLDPGLAFGTGTHQTTALCLTWLDSADLQGKTVVDFGCGSGILAIAALKLGAAKVIGVDHDPQALLASKENAKRNGFEKQFEVYLNEDFKPQTADLVMANILANILIDLHDDISPLIKVGGEMILSGILSDQAEEVTHRYSEKLAFSPSKQLDNWMLLHAKKLEN